MCWLRIQKDIKLGLKLTWVRVGGKGGYRKDVFLLTEVVVLGGHCSSNP